ncbi:MAG: ribonuclease III [Pyramidobacter sp.]|jgi:ribonuclease-3
MSKSDKERQRVLDAFQRRIGYAFESPSLLDAALTHSSYAHEYGLSCWNERLEFLGDAVLELLISDELFRELADAGEGELTRERASRVREEVLSAWGHVLGVDRLLRAGKGQRGNVSENMVGDAVEAILGAIYLDGGLEAARTFLRLCPKDAQQEVLDAKSRLQIYCQERSDCCPEYQVLTRTGPDHNPLFTVQIRWLDKSLGRGRGSSRKAAEQDAARNALRRLDSESARSER